MSRQQSQPHRHGAAVDLTRPALKEAAAWIRDTLDPEVARNGPDYLRSDDVLKLHELFVALLNSQTLTTLDLRATGILRAVMDVCGTATRWPGRLADDCDAILLEWQKRFGRLDDLRPFMYGRGGRLEGIARPGEFSRQALLKRWEKVCPEKIRPSVSQRPGDLGFKPGAWWISPLFAHHAGIINLESTEGGVCYDKTCAYAVVLRGTGELEASSEDAFTYRCKRNDKGKHRLVAATSKSRGSIRVLRSHSLNSMWGPKAGIRYEGLYRVTGWTIYAAKTDDTIGKQYKAGDLMYEVRFERCDPTPMEKVLKHPTAAELDDYAEYKRLRRVHREELQKGVDEKAATAMPTKDAPQIAAAPQLRPASMSKSSPTVSRTGTFRDPYGPYPYNASSANLTNQSTHGGGPASSSASAAASVARYMGPPSPKEYYEVAPWSDPAYFDKDVSGQQRSPQRSSPQAGSVKSSDGRDHQIPGQETQHDDIRDIVPWVDHGYDQRVTSGPSISTRPNRTPPALNVQQETPMEQAGRSRAGLTTSLRTRTRQMSESTSMKSAHSKGSKAPSTLSADRVSLDVQPGPTDNNDASKTSLAPPIQQARRPRMPGRSKNPLAKLFDGAHHSVFDDESEQEAQGDGKCTGQTRGDHRRTRSVSCSYGLDGSATAVGTGLNMGNVKRRARAFSSSDSDGRAGTLRPFSPTPFRPAPIFSPFFEFATPHQESAVEHGLPPNTLSAVMEALSGQGIPNFGDRRDVTSKLIQSGATGRAGDSSASLSLSTSKEERSQKQYAQPFPLPSPPKSLISAPRTATAALTAALDSISPSRSPPRHSPGTSSPRQASPHAPSHPTQARASQTSPYLVAARGAEDETKKAHRAGEVDVPSGSTSAPSSLGLFGGFLRKVAERRSGTSSSSASMPAPISASHSSPGMKRSGSGKGQEAEGDSDKDARRQYLRHPLKSPPSLGTSVDSPFAEYLLLPSSHEGEGPAGGRTEGVMATDPVHGIASDSVAKDTEVGSGTYTSDWEGYSEKR